MQDLLLNSSYASGQRGFAWVHNHRSVHPTSIALPYGKFQYEHFLIAIALLQPTHVVSVFARTRAAHRQGLFCSRFVFNPPVLDYRKWSSDDVYKSSDV